MLDLRGSIPGFVRVFDGGKPHDVHAFDLLAPKHNATYVVARANFHAEGRSAPLMMKETGGVLALEG